MRTRVASRLRLACAALLLAMLAACSSAVPVETDAAASSNGPAPPASVYVLRRGRHTDLVLPVEQLGEQLSTITADFAAPRYLVFGFGDRQYMLATHKNAWHALLAPFPGAGVMLVTGMQEAPQQAYGADHLAALSLSASQLRELQRFVWDSLEQDPPGAVRPYLPGQLPGNVYYASTHAYYGFYTCNTWTAEALQRAGLPVRSGGVLFAGQVWEQVEDVVGATPPH